MNWEDVSTAKVDEWVLAYFPDMYKYKWTGKVITAALTDTGKWFTNGVVPDKNGYGCLTPTKICRIVYPED